MRYVTTLLLALAVCAPSLPAQRLTLDLRGAVAAPMADLADADLGAGRGLGGGFAWQIQPHLHIYAGWDWMRFAADNSFAGPEAEFEETGYTLGLRFQHPLRQSARLSYRLEAGGTYKHIEIEDSAGDIIEDSGHGLGFELGAGLLMPLGAGWKLAPTLRYRALSRDFAIGGTTTSGKLEYAALEIGFSRQF